VILLANDARKERSRLRSKCEFVFPSRHFPSDRHSAVGLRLFRLSRSTARRPSEWLCAKLKPRRGFRASQCHRLYLAIGRWAFLVALIPEVPAMSCDQLRWARSGRSQLNWVRTACKPAVTWQRRDKCSDALSSVWPRILCDWRSNAAGTKHHRNVPAALDTMRKDLRWRINGGRQTGRSIAKGW
jgi:hypothetical protein